MKKAFIALAVIAVCLGIAWFAFFGKSKNPVVDTKEIELSLNPPKYLNSQTVEISGKTDPGMSVLVRGIPAKVDEDGVFTCTLYGKDAASQILQVVAFDNKTGKRAMKELDLIPPR